MRNSKLWLRAERVFSRRPMRTARTACVAGLALFACSDVEEAVKGLEVIDAAAYWSVRGKAGDENYIRPVVRFRIRNQGSKEVGYIQAMAVFRRVSAPDESWGSGYEHSVTSGPLASGEVSPLVTLKSDSNYISKDEPENMFRSKEWQDVVVEIFLRAGASSWRSAAELEVPKHLGAPGVEKFLEPPEPSPQPSSPPPGPSER